MSSTPYRKGYEFERRVRAKLLEDGAVEVFRSAGSKTKVDLVAADEPDYILGGNVAFPNIRLVQCKRNGKLPKKEREALLELARKTGATPVLAKAGKNGRGIILETIREAA